MIEFGKTQCSLKKVGVKSCTLEIKGHLVDGYFPLFTGGWVAFYFLHTRHAPDLET